MRVDTAKYVASCGIFQKVKAEHQRLVGLLKPLEIPMCKLENITMDFVVGLLLAPTNVTTGKAAMTPADANWGRSISWTTNKSASARNTGVAFYPGVYRGVIYISAGKAVNEEI